MAITLVGATPMKEADMTLTELFKEQLEREAPITRRALENVEFPASEPDHVFLCRRVSGGPCRVWIRI